MKILVVEDERRVAEAVKRALESDNYQVDWESDSAAALKAARRPDFYGLIILDRMLPGPYDGLEIVSILRENNISTPILLLTALGEVKDRVEGLQTGADDYLVKPFSIRELLARVKVLLKRPKVAMSSVIQVGTLKMDTQTQRVTRADKPVKLSNREYKLLHYLLYNQGEILSKERLIAHVWNENADIMTNTVEVYMAYLRKKIDRDFPGEKPLIETVFGFGYRIGG